MLYDAAEAQKTAVDSKPAAASTGGMDGRSEKDTGSGSAVVAAQDEPGISGQQGGSGEMAKQGKDAAGPEWSVQYDFAHHPYYPVLRLKHAALPKN